MPLVTREGKGSKLTIEEMDGNLTGLNSGEFIFDEYLTTLSDFPASATTGGFAYGEVNISQIVDFSLFLQNLEDELYEPFLGPIIETDVTYSLFGQLLQKSEDSVNLTLFNGFILGAGGGIFGAGCLNILNQPGTFLSKLELAGVSVSYLYTYDDLTGDHFHNFTIESALFTILKTTFEVSINDSATSWADVTVNTYTLLTP